MKQTKTKHSFSKQLPLIFLSVITVLFASNIARANDPDLSISPVFGLFPHAILGTDSPIITFSVKNTHPTNNLELYASSLTGTHATEFTIVLDNCNTLVLLPDQECGVDVAYSPTSFGSKMAMLQVNTNATNSPALFAFLSNDEDTRKEAERRLPPVLFSVNIPENMDRNTLYTLNWSILGYHESYQSVIALFDCAGKAAGTCGANFAENFANSGLITATGTTPQPAWTFNGEPAVEHHYSYAFTPASEGFPAYASGSYEIVVRFYRKNNMDVMSGEASLSLMIPGNLSGTYYDNEGRRITKYITIP